MLAWNDALISTNKRGQLYSKPLSYHLLGYIMLRHVLVNEFNGFTTKHSSASTDYWDWILGQLWINGFWKQNDRHTHTPSYSIPYLHPHTSSSNCTVLCTTLLLYNQPYCNSAQCCALLCFAVLAITMLYSHHALTIYYTAPHYIRTYFHHTTTNCTTILFHHTLTIIILYYTLTILSLYPHKYNTLDHTAN